MTKLRTIMGAGHKMLAWMLPALVAGIVTWILGVTWTVVPLPPAATWAGAVLTGLGVIGYLWSATEIVRSFRAGQLVTTGSFGLCRHPLYATWILLLLPGLALLSGNLLFVLADALLLAGHFRFIGEEEQELLAEFGDAYRDYASRHFGLLPLGPHAPRGVARERPAT